MSEKSRVGIHQPNFMPWLGYFYKVFESDVFILLDDAQFQKTGSSYTNRVSINANGCESYLTIPVKRPPGVTAINETEFARNNFRKKISGSLQTYYARAPYFGRHRELIFDLVNHPADNLADYNSQFINAIIQELGLRARIERSSFVAASSLPTEKLVQTERLAQLVTAVGGNVYISGKGGDKYQDHSVFSEASIAVEYTGFRRFEYPQNKAEEFIPGLSIVDAIFAIGIERLRSDFFVHDRPGQFDGLRRI